MKNYAKQIAPEYQESPLLYEDEYYDDIIVIKNNNFNADIYNNISSSLEDAVGEIIDIKNGHSSYNNVTSFILDYFPPKHKKSYSTKEISQWKILINNYSNCHIGDEINYIAVALSLIMGKEYLSGVIRGCCQGDYEEILYPKNDYEKESIQCFEIAYFNLGSEWIVSDSSEEYISPDEVEGMCVYCYSWDDDGIRKEIAEATGEKPEDVVMYKYDGYYKVLKYKEVI